MEDLLARCAAAGVPVAPATDAAVHAGSVRLRHGTVVDEAEAREVTVAARVAGKADETRVLQLPRLRSWQRPHRGADQWRTPLPPWAMRLSRQLRVVRRVLGDADLVVHWADDGRVCHVISVQRG